MSLGQQTGPHEHGKVSLVCVRARACVCLTLTALRLSPALPLIGWKTLGEKLTFRHDD